MNWGVVVSIFGFVGVFIFAWNLPLANYLGLLGCCVLLNVAYPLQGWVEVEREIEKIRRKYERNS